MSWIWNDGTLNGNPSDKNTNKDSHIAGIVIKSNSSFTQCAFCDFIFNTDEEMKNHNCEEDKMDENKVIHDDYIFSDSIASCAVCGSDLFSFNEINNHNCKFPCNGVAGTKHYKNCFFSNSPETQQKEESKTYNTTVEVKRANFEKFTSLIGNQFNHGGDKYKLPGFEDREATDVISSVFGGESEFDWILGTMMKYIFRFKNFNREKDLLKVATYCYILWLKQGNHLKESHDEDTKK